MIRSHDYSAPLEVKYGWVNGQLGPAAVESAATSVRSLGGTLGAITTAAGDSMRGLGVSWAGPASDAARRSSEKAVDGASETQRLTEDGAARIEEYGASFDRMRRKISEPLDYGWLGNVAVDGILWGRSVWDGAPDHVTRATLNRVLDDVARDALLEHETFTRQLDEGFTTEAANRPPTPGAGGGVPGGGVPGGGVPGGGIPGGGVPGGGAAGPGVSPHVSAIPQVEAAGVVPGATAGADVPPTGSASAPGGPGTTAGQGAGPQTAAAGAGPAGLGAAPGPRPGDAVGTGGVGTGPGSGGAAGGVAGPGGAAGPVGAAGGLPDASRTRAGLGEQFGRDLAAGSPAAGSGAAAPGSRGGWYGSGVPGAGGPTSFDRTAGRAGSGYVGAGLGGTGYGGAGYGLRPGVPGGTAYGGGAGHGLRPGVSGGTAYGGGAGHGLRPGTPVGTGTGAETGARSWSRLPGTPGEGGPVRPAAGEPGATGRSATGYGTGFGPMMGGVGGARSGGDGHHNRYLLPSSEPFDVDVPHSPPVLAPDEED